MADETPHLGLPYILANQAQKQVTHNEALRLLDGIVQMAVISAGETDPPAGPNDGDRYIVAIGGTGDWAGWDGAIAYYVDGAWMKLVPQAGWRAWAAAAEFLIYDGAAWKGIGAALGFIQLGANTIVSEGPAESQNRMVVAEELLSGLSGPSVDSSIQIPNRAIVFCVSTRTVTAITGASSYDCGIAGETSKFGGSLGIAQDSSNAGVIGPQAFYADTPIRLAANGGDFAGGAVRIAIHYFLPQVPQS
tara:strand:+ start:11139 stop:11882 length:744 start_codon:yes stop_codon:yes gene_type:complete